jgi:ATP-dependent Lon protease
MQMEWKDRAFPLVALRGLAVLPCMALHFDAGREQSVAALEEAMITDKYCLLVTQKDPRKADFEQEDLYEVGTLARVKQILKLPGDSIRVLVEGERRARLVNLIHGDHFCEAEVECEEEVLPAPALAQALSRELIEAFEKHNRLGGKVLGELLMGLISEDDVGKQCDIIAANVLVKTEDKQAVLECFDVEQRSRTLIGIVYREIDIKKLEAKIQNDVKKAIEKSQREYYLREQMKAIRSELGEENSADAQADELLEKLKELPVNDEVREKVSAEIKRYGMLPPGSHEEPIQRAWLDWIFAMPWGKYSEEKIELPLARRILDEDHYGLEKIKDRVIEHLAVTKLRGSAGGTILCLVGPPGVGKTSIASSIARATGRNFVRMSLGGVRDEAEIRGHRKTYIGAIPGRIINAMKQAGSMNPLILLDEIDKMGMDHRGDPADAMLEVLDGAQNYAFRDHYLEVPFDLSRVMFVMTANTLDTIPKPLLDRMEVVQLSSYTDEEKVQIGKRHLVAKQLKEHGIAPKALSISEDAVRLLVTGYTREAGVRSLERKIGEICRKAAVQFAEGQKRMNVSPRQVQKLLGPQKYHRESVEKRNRIGVANGLAWTSVGGEVLTIEVVKLKGTGKLELTGQLGDVMKESAHAAFTYIRAHASEWNIDPLFYENTDLHIHIPEGATPKDGPSAGITMATAIVSALSGMSVRGDLAMTGEITLSGRVLAIGGLKEKTLAAYREGMKTILMPAENRRDLSEIADVVKENLELVFVEDIHEVLQQALCPLPKGKKSLIAYNANTLTEGIRA